MSVNQLNYVKGNAEDDFLVSQSYGAIHVDGTVRAVRLP
jgi:hypothetical protein